MQMTVSFFVEEDLMETQDYESKRRLIYDLLNGSLDLDRCPVPESQLVQDEFARGRLCDRLYEEIYQANLALCKRLGVDSDDQIEQMINHFSQITERLCDKMYDYGRLFALLEIREAFDCHGEAAVWYMDSRDELKCCQLHGHHISSR